MTIREKIADWSGWLLARVKDLTTAATPPDDALVKSLFDLYGEKGDFSVSRSDLPGANWPKLVRQLRGSQLVEVWSEAGITDADGQPFNLDVRLKPLTFQRLKQEKKEAPHRQIVIDQQKIDLRNRDNFLVVNAPILEVENLAAGLLHQLRGKPIKSVRRACICQLQRIMLIRGKELRRDLYGSICLRLSYPLPRDFFDPSVPRELWNEPDPPPKRGPDLLALLRKLVPDEGRLKAIIDKNNYDAYFSDLEALRNGYGMVGKVSLSLDKGKGPTDGPTEPTLPTTIIQESMRARRPQAPSEHTTQTVQNELGRLFDLTALIVARWR